jgi:hypothetical protein
MPSRSVVQRACERQTFSLRLSMTFIFLHRKAGSSRMRSIPKFHHGMMLCNARVGVLT